MKKHLMFFCALLSLVAVFTDITRASALNGGLTVSQTKIVFNADKDQNLNVPVSISNGMEEEVSVSIIKADFTIGEDGAFIVKDAGSLQNSACSLINCEENDFTMKPGEQKSFDISLKQGVEYLLPEYSSTVLVRYIPKKDLEGNATIKTYTQVAITVRVLAGSLLKTSIDTSKEPLTVAGIAGKRFLPYGGEKDIKVKFQNTGVLTVEPSVSAYVGSFFSGNVEEIPANKSYIIPGESRDFNLKVSAASLFDIRTIHVNYSYPYAGKEFAGTCSFSYLVLSYQLVIGIVLVLTVVIWQISATTKKNKLLKQLLKQQSDAAAQSASSGEPKRNVENKEGEDNKPI